MFKITTKKLVAGAVVAAVLASTGIGYAYWTTGGSGSGTAGTGSANNITVYQTASSTPLRPAGSTTLSGDFGNTQNPGPVYITTVSATIDTFSVQTDPLKPACTQADYTLTTPSVAVGAEVAHTAGTAHTGSWSGIVLEMVDNPTGNQDNCKGYSVLLTYAAV